jgi:hypothetical protein
MNNAPAILKALVIYAICVPLAVVVGYTLTDPLDYTTFAYAGILALVLLFPLLLRWHYPLLLLSVNTNAIIFFIKGRPAFWLVMVTLSLGISVLERAMSSQKRFIRVPQITWPLICMLGVVYLTAKLTGGNGIARVWLGCLWWQEIYLVDHEYFKLLCFHGTAHPAGAGQTVSGVVPSRRGHEFIGDLYPVTPSFLHFIFWIFPPSSISVE